MTDEVRVVRQPRLDGALVGPIRAIYRASFPPYQQVDFSDVVAGVNEGGAWLFTAQRGDRVLGFGTTVPLPGLDVHLGDYIAVAEEARNLGTGGALLRAIMDELRATEHVSGLLFEVEPVDSPVLGDRQLRERRVRFYQRHGAQIVECAYRMPNLAGEGSVPMLLMWLPAHDALPPAGRLLRECVIGIYRQAYGRSEDDPLLREVLLGVAC